MAVTSTPIYPQLILTPSVQILPATTTTEVTLYTATNANGSKIENIILTNTDTAAAYAIQFFVYTSSTSYLIGTVNVALSSGNTIAVPAVSVMQAVNSAGNPYIPFSYDAFGNPYMYLASGSVLKIASLTTVNTGKAVTATCVVSGDF